MLAGAGSHGPRERKEYAEQSPIGSTCDIHDGGPDASTLGREQLVDEMSRVIVAGDVHLGAHNANVEAFNGFLAEVNRAVDAIDEVVLLGDLWDMVRRDPFGVAWETTTTLDGLKRLASNTSVHYILGNHDVHLRELDTRRYELDFRTEYTLEQGGTAIHFRHGNEFDRLESSRLSAILSGPGDRGDIDPTRGRKDPLVAGVRDAFGTIKSRLRADGGAATPYPRRERRAHRFLEGSTADKLVFGHTHAPYVHHDNLVANPGSWKSTAPRHNTYVEIVEGHLALYQYRSDGDDERLE